MNFWKYTDFIFHIALTLLLVHDFFPDSFLSNLIPIKLNVWIILSLCLISILFKRLRRSDGKVNRKGQILSLIYLISVILILTYLGGESASGLGLGNVGVWIALAISIGEIFSQKRKFK